MQPDKETQEYFDLLSADVARAYSVAKSARAKGFDPEPRVDIPVAEDLAARVEGLLSTVFPELLNSGLKEEIRALEATYGKNDERVALLIGKKASEGAFSKFTTMEKAIEAGLRAAVAYLTLGIVTAPLEGVSDVKIRKNPDGTEYLAVYFAGPIRSAGGTASAMSVLAADFIRKHAGVGEYKPDENEINRYVTEVEDYYTRVTPKQYHPTREEIEMIIKNIPVEITGDPTEKLEVSNYKDLPRVETNRIRGGMCLVLLDGVPLKAEKLLARVKKYPPEYRLENWLWLEKFIVLKHKIHAEKKQETGAKYVPNTKYLSKVIAGRPVISFPAKPGGFRLRYGRPRTGGLAAVAIHPATMYLTEFLAVGTQIATELPGKASVCSACDTIDPPTVLLKNGDVIDLHTREDAIKFRAQVQKVLALGDILVPFGEFVSNNHVLLPAAYVEEWWVQDVLSAAKEVTALKSAKFMSKPYPAPEFVEAVAISRDFGVPLHPKYNFFWHDISVEDVCRLIEWAARAKAAVGANELHAEGVEVKEILETLCVPHSMSQGDEITVSESAKPLYFTLGSPTKENKEALAAIARQCSDAVSAVSKLSGVKIMMHGPTRVGVKMGRPEKAERRLLKGRPQVLFPCGSEGGRMRNIMDAFKKGEITATLYTAYCPQCKKDVHNILCPFCRTKTVEKTYCTVCGLECAASFHCNQPTKHYRKGRVDVHALGVTAAKRAGVSELPKIVKGVRGVFGQNRHAEPLEKGFLRAQHDLYVNKDGTTRYDASDMSLTHFRPREIGTSADKLRAIGYLKDMYGAPLEGGDQLLELKPQDIIISDNSDFSGATYLVRIAQFIDSLLERYYGLPKFYNISSKEDLIGTLVIGLAPHTSAGIIGRIIGYTPAKVCFAHPFWHAGKRRNCDGDEDSIMLLLDALLNFSREFLPDRRGGRSMDAPLVLTTCLNPEEVDDEAWNVDIDDQYSREFYESTYTFPTPKEAAKKPRLVASVIRTPEVFHIKFTHDTKDINEGPLKTKYVELDSMSDKLDAQLSIAKKLRSVDENKVAEEVLSKHFFRDIKGNARTFSYQKFRCVSCNDKYRRPPLSGRCLSCGGRLLMTVTEGSVKKYIEPSRRIMDSFKVSTYLRQQFALLEDTTDQLFGHKGKQLSLSKFNGK